VETEPHYKYHYRPGYGSDKLLIEFVSGVERDTFFNDLFDALKEIRPNVIGMTDLWMNDEFVYEVDSDKGSFSVSKDIWDFAFITSDRNQDCISAIDRILVADVRFEKVEVDYEKYKGV
jgi:hypothetical protein